MKLSKLLRSISLRYFTNSEPLTLNNQIVSKSNKKELQYKQFEKKFDLPLKIGGMKNIQEEKPSFMFNQILNYSKISRSWIIDHLQKIYFGTMLAIEKDDKEFLEEYLEPTLASKLQEQIRQIKNDGYKVILQDYDRR